MTATLVRLRDVRAEDLDAFFEHQRDPEGVAMAAFPSRDEEAFRSHWARVLANAENRTRTIEVAGTVAGHVACFPLNDVLNVGYWLGRSFWGKGIATAALGQFLREIQARPLFAHVAVHNVGSRRVLEKCGFIPVDEEAEVGEDGVTELLFRLD